jgi:hypothetical protein
MLLVGLDTTDQVLPFQRTVLPAFPTAQPLVAEANRTDQNGPTVNGVKYDQEEPFQR